MPAIKKIKSNLLLNRLLKITVFYHVSMHAFSG